MPHSDVDKLSAQYDAFARRDLDGAVEYAHPDIAVRPAIEGIDTQAHYRGRDGFKQFLEQITGTWEAESIEPIEILASPDGRVLVFERWHVRGRDGLELHFDIYDLYTFRDGLVVGIEGFRKRAEALEAAGLA